MKIVRKLLVLTAIFVLSLTAIVDTSQGEAAVKGKDKNKVVPGIEVFLKNHLQWVKGKRVGLITNPTGVDSSLRSDIDLLNDHPNVELTALFGPEHGIRGDQPAGKYIESYVDDRTGLPVYSLYGSTWKPTEEMLEDVDVLLFDIQDIGSNVYTYIYTLGFAMEAAAEFDKELIVLDRPNTTGGVQVEGPLRDEETVSFMGRFLLPIRHGMTVGELASMWNHEYSLGVNLKVAKMKGWKRDMTYEETGLPFVPPSPNIPSTESAFLYAGTELLDDTSLSMGLGTTKPFELAGAPWIDGHELADELNSRLIKGVTFRPSYYTPMFGKYKGELNGGVQIYINDKQKVNLIELGLHLLDAMKDQNPEKFTIDPAFDSLFGDKRVAPMLMKDANVKEITDLWKKELNKWTKEVRNNYLLYGPYPKGSKPYQPSAVLGILPLDLNLAPGETEEIAVHGFDSKGDKLTIPENKLKWKVSGEIGNIRKGIFYAEAAGTGRIEAGYGKLLAQRNVTVDYTKIKNIRYGVNDGYTRLVIDLSRNTKSDIEVRGNQMTIKIPMANADESYPPAGVIEVSGSPVVSKIEYEITGNQLQAIVQLKKESLIFDTPYFSNRLVIDIKHEQ